MASQPAQDIPAPSSGSGANPSGAISSSSSQISANADSESTPGPHPTPIPLRFNTGPDPAASQLQWDRAGNRSAQRASASTDMGLTNPTPSLQKSPEELEAPQLPAPGSPLQHDHMGIPRSLSFREPGGPQRQRSGLDWIVPHESKREPRERTLEERLRPTIESAKRERAKARKKARMSGYALNAAIGMQVILGALTTGVSAAVSGRQASIATSFLGGLATLVASYLARQRGSKEPELSTMRCKDLDQFLRECEIFVMDHGHLSGHDHDQTLDQLRQRFEELLGNANGERRLAMPA